MDEPNVRVAIEDFIAVVTLDRPPVNATSRAMVLEIQAAFDSFNNNPNVRVAILVGAGKIFCAGADVKMRASSLESGQAGQPGSHALHARIGREGFYSIMDCEVPVIGALNGAAVGAGLAFAASCDYLIASETAFIALNEINVGLLGGGRHAQRLLGTFGARRLMYSGDRIHAAELLERNVVEKVVPAGALMQEALAMARVIAEKSPTAIKMAKRAMNAVEFMSIRDGYRLEQTMTGELSRTEDAANAFVEKRKPIFKGS
ncbi:MULTISPECIES: enoyl-CoA hydratase/isomerase family protein [unclassified Pigmentiphaga]|uniref:enoyl-CoA hydratase/isomerase family protein n=1 Tax=unclassified Pigmentiphaga TaxID=2626614 RepID=UPI000B416C58|nr:MULTISPECIES: enoyl-CoA hydratase/isomerase family protein [unclassified Pigmentiphaga]OVZ66444.1 hypothetical protein CDO46_00765 [Pigmentiphaga sp. NML030171]